LVTLSLEELKAISGGASTTLDEQVVKTSKSAEANKKTSTRGEEGCKI